jgi:uncharacterized phiE125 gp8 family phage protein
MQVTTVTVNHCEDDQIGESADAAAQTFSVAVAATVAPDLEVAEPITLEQAKAHLRVVVPDDDEYISGLITTARQMAEGRLNRTLAQRRRVATFGHWGASMSLLKPPIISVDNIGYVDDTGSEVILDPAAFYVPPVSEDEMPRVELHAGVYPTLVHGRRDAVRVYYTAGYPVGQVPAPIVQWMLLAIGTMYENRESEVIGATVEMLPDNFVKWLLQPYQVYE